MVASRKFGVFAIAFAAVYPVFYIAATEFNLALFTYHPALGEFGFGVNKPRDGLPAMYWFGWMSSSAIAALAIAAAVAALPDGMTRRLPATLAWLVPMGAMAAAAGLMINIYFTR